ncbi:MAG: variant-type mycofactocin precursor [Thermodesulfobacteriota bacterium]
MKEEIIQEETTTRDTKEQFLDPPEILEEITMEEMAVDGICGIY